MFRLSTFFLVIFTSTVGAGVFHIKYEVARLEKNYDNIQSNIATTQNKIHVLRVEWAHLNDPVYLQKLAETHLTAKPVEPHQVVFLEPYQPPKDSKNEAMSQANLKNIAQPQNDRVIPVTNEKKIVTTSTDIQKPKRKSLDDLIARVTRE